MVVSSCVAADGDGTDSECITGKFNIDLSHPFTREGLFVNFFSYHLDNGRKCRARYGMEQQDMWCEPCRY